MLAIVVHVPVAADQISTGRVAVAVLNALRSVPPPLASTPPSGSTVRFMNDRRNAIDPVACQVGFDLVMSMTNAVAAAVPLLPLSAAVPAFRIFPGAYITADAPSI